MKKNRVIVATIALSCMSFMIFSATRFTIILKPKWRDLETDSKKNIDFGGKWMLVGSITFKKKCKDPMALETLHLHWNGEPISNLVASLYKKDFSRDFLPIDKNLMCDGVWNKSKQTLIFNFEEKETLAPTTTFYLVFTIPEELEANLLQGSFSLIEHFLPKQFKECCQSNNLSLAIQNIKTNSTYHTA